MKYPSGRLTVRCSVSLFLPVTTELTLKTLESLEKAELLCHLHISIHSKRCHRGGGGFGQLTRAWPIQTLHSCLLLSVFTLHFPPVVDEKMFLLRSILYTVFFSSTESGGGLSVQYPWTSWTSRQFIKVPLIVTFQRI